MENFMGCRLIFSNCNIDRMMVMIVVVKIHTRYTEQNPK